MTTHVAIRCDCGWKSIHRATDHTKNELTVTCNQEFDAHASSCWRATEFIESKNRQYGLDKAESRDYE